MQVIQLKTCPRQFATLCALNPYHWMETKFVRYSHLIFVGFRYKIGDSLSPNFNPSFSASAKLTERLHGSSEYIAAWQPNHNGPVPTSIKLNKASTVSSTLTKLVLIIVPFNFFHLLQMNGFNEFEARRRKKFDKQIDSRVMMGSTALDEGVDFHWLHSSSGFHFF